jgi:opacity protein-like surface antigen
MVANMKKLTLLAALLVAPTIASAQYPDVTWCGFYLGLNAGAAINNDRTNFDYDYVQGDTNFNFAATFGNAADNSVNNGSTPGIFNVNGLNAVDSAIAQGVLVDHLGSSWKTVFTGGLHGGFNWQREEMVFGFEADIDWMSHMPKHDFSGTACDQGCQNFFTNSGETEANVDWLSTERLRLGYAYNNILPYITAGFAFGGTKVSTNTVGTDGSTVDTFAGSKSETRTGWAAGAGIAFMFAPGWDARIEGIYYDLGTAHYNVAPQDANSASEGLTVNARHKFDGTLVRAGVTYTFNGLV